MIDTKTHRTFSSLPPGPSHRTFGTPLGGILPEIRRVFERKPKRCGCSHCFLSCGCPRFRWPR